MAGATGSAASAGRATGRGTARAFSASATAPSSVTTADRPIRIRPPVSAVVPAMMDVVPRLNSLIVLPIRSWRCPRGDHVPNISNVTDIAYTPAPPAVRTRQARCYGLRKNFGPVPAGPQ